MRGLVHHAGARIARRLVDLLGPTGQATRQSLSALGFNSATSFVAGLCMAGMWSTFSNHPELLIMIPAAIGLRGNVFGSCGNRLSTSIHMGTFEVSLRRGSVLSDNVIGSLVLSAAMSVMLAVLALGAAVVFGLTPSLSLGELLYVSIVGGTLASVVVMVATVALAVIGVRRGWDLDNLVAPSVSTLGDVITVPAIWVAALTLPDVGQPVGIVGYALAATALALFVWALRSADERIARVTAESTPVLMAAAVLSGLGGIVMSKRLGAFNDYPALLILVPAFVSSVGALGGILSSRLATSLHLGTVDPDVVPPPEARADFGLIAALAVPVMIFNAGGAHLLGRLTHQQSPGLAAMLGATVVAAALAVAFVVMLAYYGTIASWRFSVDPDTYGIPTVSAAVDFVGVSALVLAFVAVGTL